MKLNSFLLCFFLLGLTQLSAQIMYSEETIKKRYDQETILLTPQEYQKNGFLKRLSLAFPSRSLREEIEKNGGAMARDQHKQYRENLGWFWGTYLSGIVGYLVIVAALTGTTTAISGIAIAGLVASLLLLLGSFFFFNKATRNLFKAVWFHNREVLLRKE